MKIRIAEGMTFYDAVGVNTEYGFAHIVTSDELVIQCCLEPRKDGKGFKKQIKKSDCGFDDGICGEVNAEAFKKYGVKECLCFLLTQMRRTGVKII